MLAGLRGWTGGRCESAPLFVCVRVCVCVYCVRVCVPSSVHRRRVVRTFSDSGCRACLQSLTFLNARPIFPSLFHSPITGPFSPAPSPPPFNSPPPNTQNVRQSAKLVFYTARNGRRSKGRIAVATHCFARLAATSFVSRSPLCLHTHPIGKN